MEDKTTKEKALALLKERAGEFISGQELADTLFITRAGIWKIIRSLKQQGFDIDAVSNRGYRLNMEYSPLSESRIRSYLEGRMAGIPFYIYDSIDSTNDRAIAFCKEGHPGEAVFISDCQTGGKGRRGRSFYSPAGTGLYLSFLLHPKTDIRRTTLLTCLTAEAGCRAISDLTGQAPSIKWVNDIYMGRKKVSGTLTEASFSMEDGSLEYVVVGIGFNVLLPKGGFPEDIRDKAGAIFEDQKAGADVRNHLCGRMLYHFDTLYSSGDNSFLDGYKAHSFLPGHRVRINSYREDRQEDEYALVTGIDDDCRLLVRYPDGTEKALSSGEVSVVLYDD